MNIKNSLKILNDKINKADAVVIGVGAGLSTAAGFTYDGERFKKYFGDFIDKYGFCDMYSGGFYPFENLREHWAYWSRYIYINRYMDNGNETYGNLKKLMENKNIQVITTNVDHLFQKNGFDKKYLFYTQGDYGLFQCSTPCHNKTYANEKQIKQMVDTQENMKVPSDLIPHCPVCNAPMSMNLRADNTFVEDKGWKMAAKRYKNFLDSNKDKRVLFLELGVGYNTPSIIKFPFWQMTNNFKDAFYICINDKDSYIPKEIDKKSLFIKGNIRDILNKSVELK